MVYHDLSYCLPGEAHLVVLHPLVPPVASPNVFQSQAADWVSQCSRANGSRTTAWATRKHHLEIWICYGLFKGSQGEFNFMAIFMGQNDWNRIRKAWDFRAPFTLRGSLRVAPGYSAVPRQKGLSLGMALFIHITIWYYIHMILYEYAYIYICYNPILLSELLFNCGPFDAGNFLTY